MLDHKDILKGNGMKFSVLATGSKANCTVVQFSDKSAVLVDCGLSAKQTEFRLRQLGVDPASLRGIVVTHEHSDHVRGISVLSRRYSIPVYATEGTEQFVGTTYYNESIQVGTEFQIGMGSLMPFPIVHDAHDPVGFVIECAGVRIGIATDLGRVTEIVRQNLRGCHALLLEANYDPDLLYSCHYPWQVKQRIASAHGHLSNDESSSLLMELWHEDLRHVVLGHLSENSNSIDAVYQSFETVMKKENYFDFVCGNPYQSTRLVTIGERGYSEQDAQNVWA